MRARDRGSRNPTVGGELASNARRHTIETAIELE